MNNEFNFPVALVPTVYVMDNCKFIGIKQHTILLVKVFIHKSFYTNLLVCYVQ